MTNYGCRIPGKWKNKNKATECSAKVRTGGALLMFGIFPEILHAKSRPSRLEYNGSNYVSWQLHDREAIVKTTEPSLLPQCVKTKEEKGTAGNSIHTTRKELLKPFWRHCPHPGHTGTKPKLTYPSLPETHLVIALSVGLAQLLATPMAFHSALQYTHTHTHAHTCTHISHFLEQIENYINGNNETFLNSLNLFF